MKRQSPNDTLSLSTKRTKTGSLPSPSPTGSPNKTLYKKLSPPKTVTTKRSLPADKIRKTVVEKISEALSYSEYSDTIAIDIESGLFFSKTPKFN